MQSQLYNAPIQFSKANLDFNRDDYIPERMLALSLEECDYIEPHRFLSVQILDEMRYIDYVMTDKVTFFFRLLAGDKRINSQNVGVEGWSQYIKACFQIVSEFQDDHSREIRSLEGCEKEECLRIQHRLVGLNVRCKKAFDLAMAIRSSRNRESKEEYILKFEDVVAPFIGGKNPFEVHFIGEI